MFLLKRHTSGCCLYIFFDLVFALAVSAPHSFDKSRFIVDGIFEFFVVCCNISMSVTMCTCALQHLFLHEIKNFLNFGSQLIEGNNIFFSCVTTADHSLSVLDILRTTFDTNRNTTHFLLCKFESRTSVCIVHFDTDACSFQCCKQFVCFFQNSFFTLLDRDDHCLCRSNSRRQDKSAVVTMNHDDRTDHTCGHSP